MSFKSRNFISLVCFILLWRFHRIKCYVDICDMPQSSIYCSCEAKSKEITVTCFIFGTLQETDESWSSLRDVDNAVALTLHSRLQTRLNYIPLEAVKEMSHLKYLIVLEGDLGEMQSYSLSSLRNLLELRLERNEITSLGHHAIYDLPLLKILSLSENFLQEFLAESLSRLPELEQLFLDRNNISRIESCAFCELQNLRDLGLWGNRITDLTEYTFRGLRYLNQLDLYKNQIRILNDKVFQAMPKLAEMDLKDNLIEYIAPGAFRGLDNLRMLILNQNRIKMLPDQVFRSLPKLVSVDLYANQLENLQVEVLEHMTNAKNVHFTLMFKENPLKCGCDLQWIHSYLKLNKSHQLTRELQELKCRTPEQEEPQLARLLKMKCEKRKTTATTSLTSVITTIGPPTKLQIYNGTELYDEDFDDEYISDVDDDSGCSSSIPNSSLFFSAIISVLLASSYWKA